MNRKFSHVIVIYVHFNWLVCTNKMKENHWISQVYVVWAKSKNWNVKRDTKILQSDWTSNFEQFPPLWKNLKKTSSIKENHSKHLNILNFEHLSMLWTFTIRTMHKYILPKSILPIQRLKTLKTQDLCWFYSRKKLNCCSISFSKVSHMPLKTECPYYFLWADHLLLLCEKKGKLAN